MIQKIHLEPGKSIEALKNEFNKIYPYLKIEFFKQPHVTGKGSSKNIMIGSGTQLGEIQKVKKRGSIVMNGKDSVSDFEQAFEKKYGLYIQVFRKSGNVWIETSATDNWTLIDQNEEGEMLAQDFKTEKENTRGR